MREGQWSKNVSADIDIGGRWSRKLGGWMKEVVVRAEKYAERINQQD